MLNLDFLEKVLDIVSLPHLVMIFEDKYFSCCTLLTEQISLPDFFYFLRY